MVIKSIDRLGRNYDMILKEWDKITNIIEADIYVIDIPLLDTRVKNENLTGKLISNLVLQILSYVAENEKNAIKERQKEGIKLAKEKGIKFGRPKVIHDINTLKVFNKYYNNEISLQEAAKITHYKQTTFLYHYKNYQKK